ncbi:MAG: glycoside hydrolase family protein [Caulobacteraceae bacterium]
MTDPHLAAILSEARASIERDEGCREVAYPDPLSGGEPWTIGYGQTGPDIIEGTVWTFAECDAALTAALNELVASLDVKLPWWRDLDAPRAAVLVEMAYQMGVAGLLGFTSMLREAERGNWLAASADMLISRWADETPERASRLAAQMRTGVIAQ